MKVAAPTSRPPKPRPQPRGEASRDPRPREEQPRVTVDVALISAAEGTLRTLVLERTAPPEAGRWALPGGVLRAGEPLEAAAARVLEAGTGLRGLFLEQLFTFGAPGREPGARVISVAYYALCDFGRFSQAGAPPAAGAGAVPARETRPKSQRA